MNHSSSIVGKRIVITRSAGQAKVLADKLAPLGAKPVIFPVIRFVPLPAPLEMGTGRYDWLLFTSVNAVEFFFRRMDELGLPLEMPHVAAVGSATAVALQSHHIPTDFTPGEFTGEALAAGLGDLTGQRILLPRSRIGSPKIVARLRAQGAEVDDVALYDTVTAVPTPAALTQLAQGFDLITFTSPSSIRSFLEIIDEPRLQRFSNPLRSMLNQAAIACIGPVTADEARRQGLSVVIMPEAYTIDRLVQAIANYYESSET